MTEKREVLYEEAIEELGRFGISGAQVYLIDSIPMKKTASLKFWSHYQPELLHPVLRSSTDWFGESPWKYNV